MCCDDHRVIHFLINFMHLYEVFVCYFWSICSIFNSKSPDNRRNFRSLISVWHALISCDALCLRHECERSTFFEYLLINHCFNYSFFRAICVLECSIESNWPLNSFRKSILSICFFFRHLNLWIDKKNNSWWWRKDFAIKSVVCDWFIAFYRS